MNIRPEDIIDSEGELRSVVGTPSTLVAEKTIDYLDKYCVEFIERSSFVMIGSSNKKRQADVSPRGDYGGFTHVIDRKTIFMPERPGNKRVDTLSNIIQNSHIGLLFLVPGFDDCLRVNGQAKVVKHPDLLKQSAVNNKVPKLGILVSVQEAMLHCAKAIRRANLWSQNAKYDRAELPSIGKIMLEQTANGRTIGPELVSKVDLAVEKDYKDGMY